MIRVKQTPGFKSQGAQILTIPESNIQSEAEESDDESLE